MPIYSPLHHESQLCGFLFFLHLLQIEIKAADISDNKMIVAKIFNISSVSIIAFFFLGML